MGPEDVGTKQGETNAHPGNDLKREDDAEMIADGAIILAELRRLERQVEKLHGSIAQSPVRSQSSKDAARLVLAAHRAIDAIFDFDGFATSPAWDILLEIYAAGTLATSDAAVGGGCAPTTGLRWLAVLQDRGLVYRFDDARDARRKLVVLSARATELVETSLNFYRT